MEKFRVLDLFSGIGGFSLGLERTGGFETVAFCEIDPFCRNVLRRHWPDVPIFEDVRELTADAVGPVDVIVGGYPCQPFSLAGKRRGDEDDRHLWPEARRLVASLRPTWCVFENVPGHISMGLDSVLSDLESENYACWPAVIPACAVDAPHRRNRLWIVANAEVGTVWTGFCADRSAEQRGRRLGHDRCQNAASHTSAMFGKTIERGQQNGNHASLGDLDDADGQPTIRSPIAQEERCAWPAEPNVGRVAHGVPSRVDRLRSLGNAVVPQIPEAIGMAILEAEDFG